MAINIADELNAATTKGKLGSAKQIFLEGDTETLQQIGEATHQLEDTVKEIAATGGASTAVAVTYDNSTSGSEKLNAQAALDELYDAKANKTDVNASISELKTKDNSQDEEIAKKANSEDVDKSIEEINTELDKKFDKDNIVQKLGDAEDKVVSQKALNSEITSLKGLTDAITKNVTAETAEEVIIGNSDTDYIAKLNSDGAYANAFYEKNSEGEYQKIKTFEGAVLQELGNSEEKVISQKVVSEELSALKNTTDAITKNVTAETAEEVIIGNSDTDYIAKLNSDGAYANAFYEKNSEGEYQKNSVYKLTGKKVVGVGDSLSGTYEKYFCSISGASFMGTYSKGGSMTPPNGNDGTQDRIKKLITDNVDFDILLLENVNDSWFAYDSLGTNPKIKGTIEDESFMLSQCIEIDSPSVTLKEAQEYFQTNFSTIINNVENKQKGTLIKVKYITTSYIMTFSNSATSDGELIITTKGISNTVTITSGMTKEVIAQKVYEYVYEGYNKKISNNVVTLVAKTQESSIPTIDVGSTGIEVSISTSTNVSYSSEYFYGHTETEFLSIDNWKDSYISLYSLYKGIIEYVQTNKPNAKIIFVLPSVWVLNYNDTSKDLDCRNSDGSYNINKCYIANINSYYHQREKMLRQIQMEVAKLFSIKYVNCHENIGITPYNISEFYYPGDVHPKNSTYMLWAKEIYKLF